MKHRALSLPHLCLMVVGAVCQVLALIIGHCRHPDLVVALPTIMATEIDMEIIITAVMETIIITIVITVEAAEEAEEGVSTAEDLVAEDLVVAVAISREYQVR